MVPILDGMSLYNKKTIKQLVLVLFVGALSCIPFLAQLKNIWSMWDKTLTLIKTIKQR